MVFETTFLELFSDGIIVTDTSGIIVYLNPGAQAIFGYSKNELVGRQISMLMPERFREIYKNHFSDFMASDIKSKMMNERRGVYGERKDGFVFPAEISICRADFDGIIRCAAVIRDISQRQIDSLTELPDRQYFITYLENKIKIHDSLDAYMSLFLLDLNKFKQINDSHGHSSGDEVIKEWGSRLKKRVRENDLVARISGDEFTILLSDFRREEDVLITSIRIAEQITASLSNSFSLTKGDIYMKAGIGISIFPNDGRTADALMGKADNAMYFAKNHGMPYCFSRQLQS